MLSQRTIRPQGLSNLFQQRLRLMRRKQIGLGKRIGLGLAAVLAAVGVSNTLLAAPSQTVTTPAGSAPAANPSPNPSASPARTDLPPVYLVPLRRNIVAKTPLVVPAQTASALKPELLRQQAQAKMRVTFASGPLAFEANSGQTNAQVKFLARGNGYNLFLTPTEAVFTLRQPAETPALKAAVSPATSPEPATGQPMHGSPVATPAKKPKIAADTPATSSARNTGKMLSQRLSLSQQLEQMHNAKPAAPTILRMQLLGGNTSPDVSGLQPLPSKVNYFVGNDPQNWHAGVSTVSQVQYRGVYPGVDLLYYGSQRQLEYDFQVAPGADVHAIRLGFVGAEKVSLSKDGDLELNIGKQTMVEHKPVIYQEVNGKRQTVTGTYVLRGAHEVGFEIADYDHSRPLVIDPVLLYSTYWGGSSGFDVSAAITVDKAGYAYITGTALSPDFPIANAQQTGIAATSYLVFVSKFTADGSAVAYSTFLGGISDNQNDRGASIAVDGSGCAYVTGCASSGFPLTPGAFASAAAGVFITKLSPDGSQLVFSTYFGNGGYGTGIAVDQYNCVYVTGNAALGTAVTPGAFLATPAVGMFAAKFSYSGTALNNLYCTYLSSDSDDCATGIAVDNARFAYITGVTFSPNFPTTSGAYRTSLGSGNASGFVTKLSVNGSSQVYSTLVGGSQGSTSAAIAVDSAGYAYITGQTEGSDIRVTTGAYQMPNSANDYGNTFVAKFWADGSKLAYLTHLNCDWGAAIAVDRSGCAYVTGLMSGSDFPVTPDAIQSALNTRPGFDPSPAAFVTKFSADGSSLAYSTLLGGSNATYSFGDLGTGIAVDSIGNMYVTGIACSTDFPQKTPFSVSTNISADNGLATSFVTKFSATGPGAPTYLKAAPGDGWVSLVWKPVAYSPYYSAITYKVYRARQSGLPYELIGSFSPDSVFGSSNRCSFADVNVTNGTQYYYIVTAVMSQSNADQEVSGESGNSNEASALPYAGGGLYDGGSPGGGTDGSGNGTGGIGGNGTPGGEGSTWNDFTVTQSIPVQSLTLEAGGTPVTDLTIAGGTDCLGQITLAGAVPSGHVAIVHLASSVPGAVIMPSFVPVSGSNTARFAIQSSTVNRLVHITLTAFTDSHSVPATLTLTTDSLRVTNLFMPNTIRLNWDMLPVNNRYILVRDGTQIAIKNPNDPQDGPPQQYDDQFAFVNGHSYVYELYDGTDNGNGNVTRGQLLSADTVIPYKVAATDDQAVDSRLNPRANLPALLNHQFGGSAYRGGLFVGHAQDSFFTTDSHEDASRLARSYARFPISASPLGQSAAYPDGAFLRSASVNAYLTQYYTDPKYTNVPTIACAPLGNPNWVASSLSWITAPSLDFVPTDNAIAMPTVPGWVKWPMPRAILGTIQNNQPLSVGWRLSDESGWGWAYFAKREYNANLAPTLLHSWTVPTLANLTITPSQAQYPWQGQQPTGQVLVNGIGLGEGSAAVTISVSNASLHNYTGPNDILPTGQNWVSLSASPNQNGPSVIVTTDGMHKGGFGISCYVPPDVPGTEGDNRAVLPWTITATITASYRGRSISRDFMVSGTSYGPLPASTP